MLKLRRLLLSNKIYYILLIVSIIVCFIRLNITVNSKLSPSTNEITGIITNISYNGNCLSMTLKISHHENIKAYYYFTDKNQLINTKQKLKLGSKIKVKGELQKPTQSQVDNIFDYEKYLKIKHIYYLFKIDKITYIADSNNFFYLIKNLIYNYLDTFKSKSYIKMILLGDTDGVDKKVIASFRENGISHLFAISGTQVTVLAEVILIFLKKVKIKEKPRYIIVNTFTFSYLFLTGSPPAVLRAVLSFFLSSINKYNYLYITNINIFIITLSITLLINPYYVYDLGFLYSYLISAALIICSKCLDNKSKFYQLLLTSIISFLVSLPITLYTFYQLNIMSILYNLFYVPFVNNILFPLTILVIIFPFLDNVLLFFITVLEKSSLFISNIALGKLIFPKIPLIIYILYVLLLYLFYKTKKKTVCSTFILLLLFHYYSNSLFPSDYIYMLDIGQGDSILIHSNNQSLLIDTGGKKNYTQEQWQKRDSSNMSDNVTLPYLKSKGIRKLDYLVLTHGDYDHLGEALNILDNFKVNQVYINEGRVNYYEKQLKSKYNVATLKQDMSFTLGNFKFLSLNKNLQDENDNSIILYGTYNNYKMLFMGDASIKSEESILNDYDIDKVNLLKVGHHGSRTSTSEAFIKKIKPDVALISAGVNNKFNHPHQEIIDRLKKYQVQYYLTSKVGSIEINFTKNKITTYQR